MGKRICSVDGCDRPHRSKGYCNQHYQRVRKGGDPGTATIRVWGSNGCTVEACDGDHCANGYCHKHYARVRAHGAVELVPPPVIFCDVDGCGRESDKGDLCNGHDMQRRRGQDFKPLRRKRRSDVRDGQGRKQCSGCDEWKEPADFYPRTERHRDGLSTYCRRCDRDRALMDRYGITLVEYEALLQTQGGCCAICREEPGDGPALAVDHDHACCPSKRACPRCIRGLLCGECNRALGMLRDDVARLESAIDYLKNGGIKRE